MSSSVSPAVETALLEHALAGDVLAIGLGERRSEHLVARSRTARTPLRWRRHVPDTSDRCRSRSPLRHRSLGAPLKPMPPTLRPLDALDDHEEPPRHRRRSAKRHVAREGDRGDPFVARAWGSPSAHDWPRSRPQSRSPRLRCGVSARSSSRVVSMIMRSVCHISRTCTSRDTIDGVTLLLLLGQRQCVAGRRSPAR